MQLSESQLIKLSYLRDEAAKVANDILNDNISISEASRFLSDIAERLEAVKSLPEGDG